MENIVIHLISQWGLTGLVLAASCYIIWDSWKRNKKSEEWFKETMLKETHAIDSRSEINHGIGTLRDEIKKIAGESNTFRKEINNRIAVIEDVVARHFKDDQQDEADRMEAVVKISPAINTILSSSLDDCNLDHIALALLHNGTQSLAGIPYIKAGVIAEKYRPLRNPQDIELIKEYADEDIVKHNKLPVTILQSRYLEFDLTKESPLSDIDYGVYNRCKARGIKHLAFVTLNDKHDLCTGCVIAYNFQDQPIDQEELKERVSVIENLYRTMLENLE